MYNISKFENIQHDIFNFNLKRKFIIEYIGNNSSLLLKISEVVYVFFVVVQLHLV